jgi:hypothetical protein
MMAELCFYGEKLISEDGVPNRRIKMKRCGGQVSSHDVI